MYIGSRRELLWTLRQRAERAEAQRDLRLRKARSDERAAIAREMHDVLAHRISQISMYAGALAFRRDLDVDQLRAGISDVQERANDALADLRGVLGVLRDPDTGLVQHRPQPTFDDIDDLIDASRAGGARIDVENRISTRPVPTALGRTMYRIVQEGITNATKHAPGARLHVELSGGEDGVDVVVRNPLAPGAGRVPGAQLGLVGLRERVELAGGELEHERNGATFVLRASLPWVTG
jgi:signal transduction histidine kinase